MNIQMVPGYHPKLTYLLTAACILVGIFTQLSSDFDSIRPLLITNYVDVGLPEIKSGEIWRLLTPIFIHFGFFHLVLNMLWLWQLGALLEFRRGPIVFLTVIIFSAVASNLGEYYYSGPLFGGMSGVIFALLGYLWVQGRLNPRFGVKLNPGLVKMVMIWFVICWSGVLTLINLHIANVAHTVGLLSGALFAFIAVKLGNQRL
jgi:GlpG protein